MQITNSPPFIAVGRKALQIGTYNPPHLNHVALAFKAIEIGACDQVILAPKPP